MKRRIKLVLHFETGSPQELLLEPQTVMIGVIPESNVEGVIAEVKGGELIQDGGKLDHMDYTLILNDRAVARGRVRGWMRSSTEEDVIMLDLGEDPLAPKEPEKAAGGA